MIKFYDFKGELISEENFAEYVSKSTLVIYMDYEKGSEDKLTMTFEVLEKTTGNWYPLQYEDSPTTVADYYKEFSKSGKYRLMIPIAENEEKLKINLSNTDGNVIIYAIPMAIGY